MKSILIAVLVNTSMVSSLAAQATPETVKGKLPPRASVDTNTVKVIQGSEVAAADSLAIMTAVEDSGGQAYQMFVVGDTAHVFGATEKRMKPDTTREGGSISITEGVAFEHWTARVERRKGKWVQVSRKKQ